MRWRRRWHARRRRVLTALPDTRHLTGEWCPHCPHPPHHGRCPCAFRRCECKVREPDGWPMEDIWDLRRKYGRATGWRRPVPWKDRR